MELYVYSSDMVLQGIVEKIASLIWTRRYWTCGEFKLLVPFTEEHSRMLVKNNIIMKRGDDEAAAKVYEGSEPLTAEDVAESAYWIATQPPHVTIVSMEMLPNCQGYAGFNVKRDLVG